MGNKTGLSDIALSYITTIVDTVGQVRNPIPNVFTLNKFMENTGFWLMLSNIYWMKYDYYYKSFYEEEKEQKTLYDQILITPSAKGERIPTDLNPADYYILLETKLIKDFMKIVEKYFENTVNEADLEKMREEYERSKLDQQQQGEIDNGYHYKKS